jgi:hypothetical protein
MNILIPKERIPNWRPLQPRLGSFRSLHKDGKTVDPSLSVEKMFSRDELIRIANACRFTEAMGNISLSESDPSFAVAVNESIEIIDPNRKIFTGF